MGIYSICVLFSSKSQGALLLLSIPFLGVLFCGVPLFLQQSVIADRDEYSSSALLPTSQIENLSISLISTVAISVIMIIDLLLSSLLFPLESSKSYQQILCRILNIGSIFAPNMIINFFALSNRHELMIYCFHMRNIILVASILIYLSESGTSFINIKFLLGLCIVIVVAEVLNMNLSFVTDSLHSVEYYITILLLIISCICSGILVTKCIQFILNKTWENALLVDAILLLHLVSLFSQEFMQLVITSIQGSLITANTSIPFLCFYAVFPACLPILLWLLEIASIRHERHEIQVCFMVVLI